MCADKTVSTNRHRFRWLSCGNQKTVQARGPSHRVQASPQRRLFAARRLIFGPGSSNLRTRTVASAYQTKMRSPDSRTQAPGLLSVPRGAVAGNWQRNALRLGARQIQKLRSSKLRVEFVFTSDRESLSRFRSGGGASLKIPLSECPFELSTARPQRRRKSWRSVQRRNKVVISSNTATPHDCCCLRKPSHS
jgi:hypothetical protein